jgi:hypothetical protein
MKVETEFSKLYIRMKFCYKKKQKPLPMLLNEIIYFFYLYLRIYPTYPFHFKQNWNILDFSSIVNQNKYFLQEPFTCYNAVIYVQTEEHIDFKGLAFSIRTYVYLDRNKRFISFEVVCKMRYTFPVW